MRGLKKWFSHRTHSFQSTLNSYLCTSAADRNSSHSFSCLADGSYGERFVTHLSHGNPQLLSFGSEKNKLSPAVLNVPWCSFAVASFWKSLLRIFWREAFPNTSRCQWGHHKILNVLIFQQLFFFSRNLFYMFTFFPLTE